MRPRTKRSHVATTGPQRPLDNDTGSQTVIHIAIPEPAITRVLYAIAVALVVAHMAFSVNRYMLEWRFFGADNLYVLFDLWDEVSIPSWYSASLLLVCAAVLGVIGSAKWRSGERYRTHWCALAVIFLALSIDDAADIHGHTSYKLNEMMETGGFLAYAWVIPALFLVAAGGLFYVRFVRDLPSATRWRFIVAAALFLGGALGLEMVQARYDTMHGVENMPYRIMVAIEEGLEMAGTILFLSATMRYLAAMSSSIQVRITGVNEPRTQR